VAEVLSAVRAANRYFDRMQPWTLAKDPERREDLARVLGNAGECLRIVSGLLYPIMPDKMRELRQALGLPEDHLEPHLDTLEVWSGLPAGSPLGDLGTLFPRVDAKKALGEPEQAPKKEKGQKKSKAPVGVQMIDFETFGKVEMKTALVLQAERVEGSDKLLKLQVQVGAEKRQVVAGIAAYYSPEELVNRTFVMVANLKPATLFGVESNGMFLAAKAGKQLRLLVPDGDMSSGASIG
jgi:methionyl-tRNA synthetase